MWPVSWALSLSGLTPETWRAELQKQDIELLLIIESSMWAAVTAYTLAGLHWFWRKRTGRSGSLVERQQRRFSWSVCTPPPPPKPFHFSLLETFPHKSSSFQTPYDFTQHRIHLCYSQMDLESPRQAFNNHKKICSRFCLSNPDVGLTAGHLHPVPRRRRCSFQEIQSAEQMFGAACERK